MRRVLVLARASFGLLAFLGACAGDRPPSMPAPAKVASPVVAGQAAVAPGAGLVPLAIAASPPPAEVETDLVDGSQGAQADAKLELGVSEPGAQVAPAPPPRGTQMGYLLVDLASGRELASLHPDLPLIPASTTKLATAIVALDALGPEFRFRTELRAAGPVREGVLEGDLILKGGGDPALDVADLLELAVHLSTAGIREVHGRFLIDDTALPRSPEIAPDQPAEAPYNPGIGALSVAFNRVHVAWRGAGRAVEAVTLPPLEEARFEAALPDRLPPGGVELGSRQDGTVVWRVADRGRRRQASELPVKDPGLHAGNLFRRLALALDIVVGAPERGMAPADAILIAVHESAPLRQLLHDTLLYSNNMMAETIGLAAAQQLKRSYGQAPEGALLVRHLAQLMPEVDWRGAVLPNNSGLDGSARLTPRQLAAIVRYGWRSDALPALLPASGWSGTLAGRFDDAALRVWAKTGSVHYGGALAGYLLPDNQGPAAFVTMVSDLGARAAYDALPRPNRAADATASAWNARARGLLDNLVEGWLTPPPTS
jgi:D-alanyl-D-alanine carboxypeptidase/D-alanyl-D-alanine-endopeptidase (penicillin-binding protein 4)